MNPDRLSQAFETSLSRLELSDASRALRDEAMGTFGERGYPTRKHENWRYTDLKPIVTGEFDPTPESLTTDHIEHARRLLDDSQLDAGASRLVFVDGQSLPEAPAHGGLEGLAVLGPEPEPAAGLWLQQAVDRRSQAAPRQHRGAVEDSLRALAAGD